MRSTAWSPISAPSPQTGDPIEPGAARLLLSAWLVGVLSAAPAVRAQGANAEVDAEFRGCESAGWCRFRIESPAASPQALYRVRPEGVAAVDGSDARDVATRDRLNALLASMIHQHKRIRLLGMRALDDGTYAATVTVNEADVAADPVLRELGRAASGGAQ